VFIPLPSCFSHHQAVSHLTRLFLTSPSLFPPHQAVTHLAKLFLTSPSSFFYIAKLFLTSPSNCLPNSCFLPHHAFSHPPKLLVSTTSCFSPCYFVSNLDKLIPTSPRRLSSHQAVSPFSIPSPRQAISSSSCFSYRQAV
jgi:hypothetical protein